MIEIHPYNNNVSNQIPDETKLLVVGTAPPPRFTNSQAGGMRGLDFDFYYGSEDNYMWEFLENISKRKFSQPLFQDDFSSDQCCDSARSFLKERKIWMRDVLQEFQRKEGKDGKVSAADTNITPIKFSSFREVLRTKSISKFAFTSEKAAEWSLSALRDEGLLESPERYFTLFKEWRSLGRGLSIDQYIENRFRKPFAEGAVEGRNISFYILPSPTSRTPVEGFSLARKEEIYESVLFGD